MKPSDFDRRQRAARLTFSEGTAAQVVGKHEQYAQLLARSRQLIIASRRLLRQTTGRTPHKSAGDVATSSADVAGPGSAEREGGQRLWDGRPDAPECSAWHWIEDGDGLRPVLWRGEDWPAPSSCGTWQDGFASLSPGDLSRARYHGPLAMPAGAAPSRRGPTDQGG